MVGMLSDEDPIYVLDGVIVDPNTIDMDNVESVNVLKGPNATAFIWTTMHNMVLLF